METVITAVRRRIIVAHKPSARRKSDAEYRLLLRRIDSADFQLKLKRTMHGLSAVEFVKEIRHDLANEDERRHPRRARRD
jgi:hypothetical protein